MEIQSFLISSKYIESFKWYKMIFITPYIYTNRLTNPTRVSTLAGFLGFFNFCSMSMIFFY
jgi:hypothetical protein